MPSVCRKCIAEGATELAEDKEQYTRRENGIKKMSARKKLNVPILVEKRKSLAELLDGLLSEVDRATRHSARLLIRRNFGNESETRLRTLSDGEGGSEVNGKVADAERKERKRKGDERFKTFMRTMGECDVAVAGRRYSTVYVRM